MLSVFSSAHDMGPNGKPHATWTGLPSSVDDIVTCYGNQSVGAIVLEVKLGAPLPAYCINTYAGPDGIVGSYDGRSVRIWLKERLHSHDAKFRERCTAIIDLFFAIVHGHAAGERPLNADPAHYGLPPDQPSVVQQVGAMAVGASGTLRSATGDPRGERDEVDG